MEYVDFKYKRMNIPLVASLSVTNQFYFFSSDNLLWFSTNQGLTSFDGNEIQTYYPDTSEMTKYGLSNIKAIAEDKNKKLWIAAETPDYFPSLSCFDRKTGTIKKIDTSHGRGMLGKRFIKEMFIDNKGLLWMSTYEKGFYIYNINDSTIEYNTIGEIRPEEKNSRAVGIRITPHFNDVDKTWLCTSDGIYLFSLRTRKAELRYSFPTGDAMHKATPLFVIYVDATTDSTLYIGTESYGAGIYNIKRNTLAMFPPYETLKKGIPPFPIVQEGYLYLSLFSVAKRSSHEYYLYYNDSLPLIFNCVTQKYTRLYNPDLNKEIKKGLAKLLIDKQGNLWIGESKYLYVISDEFNLFHSKESPELDPISKMNALYSLVWNNETKNYYATFFYHKEIFQFDSDLNLIKKISTPFSANSDYIRLAQDVRKNIWALYPGNTNWKAPGSVCIYKKDNDRFKPIEEIYPQLGLLNKMTDMITDGKDLLIFSNANCDLFILDTRTLKLDSVSFPVIDSSKQFKSIVMKLQYDSSTKCVYVSNKKNIWQYNLEKKISKPLVLDTKTTIGKRDNVFVNASGQLWVQTKHNAMNEIQIYSPETLKFKGKLGLNDLHTEKSDRLQILRAPKPYIFFIHDEGTTLYNYEDNSFRLFDKENGLFYDFVRFTNFTNNTYFSGHNNTIQYASFDKLRLQTSEKISFISRVAVYERKNVLFPDFNNGSIILDHKKNTFGISFSCIEYLFPERIQYAFRLSELDNNWKYVDYKSREIVYSNLRPGKYVFELKAQMLGGNWQQESVKLYITIIPPFWQTWWFRTIVAIAVIGLVYWLYRLRIASIRKKEQLNSKHEKELLELEAKALRAQMNPHFIFNCMNSIKALIQNDEKQRSVDYLTTFSKLIRTLFQNSDKRQITLYDEIETCRFYTQLEVMRLNGKLKYNFTIDTNLDLKSVMVPALIIQPFIENAIWHGIVPKEEGTINVTVKGNEETIICEVDDDGIGREMSKLNKPVTQVIHESKGVHLSQARLNLEKMLNETQASIETTDKYEYDKSTGTKVVITINLH